MATWAGKQLDLNLNSAKCLPWDSSTQKRHTHNTNLFKLCITIYDRRKSCLQPHGKNARKLLLYHFYRFSICESAALLIYMFTDTKLAYVEKSVQKSVSQIRYIQHAIKPSKMYYQNLNSRSVLWLARSSFESKISNRKIAMQYCFVID